MNDAGAVRVVVGYDGSSSADAAIAAGALLVPRAHAWIAHLWAPPFASEPVRRRLWAGRHDVGGLVEAIEREGEWEAGRLVARGVTLAEAAGWAAEPVVRRTYGGEGLQFGLLAEQQKADLVLLGSRGLGGARSVLGSVSDLVVHYTPVPALVVPHPLLKGEYGALADGPVILGWDSSPGARTALDTARRLFPARDVLPVTVGDDAPPPDGDDVPPPMGDDARPPVGDDAGLTPLRVPSGPGASGRAVADALVQTARAHRAALIVVGSRGRSATQEILLGSVARSTLHRAHRPVLVVPAPRHAAP